MFHLLQAIRKTGLKKLVNKDYLDEEETENWASLLDIDFLEQNFLQDILEQINRELAIQMSDEFEKQKKRADFSNLVSVRTQKQA